MSIPLDKLMPEWKQIRHEDTICLMNADGTGADTIGVASHITAQYYLCDAIQKYVQLADNFDDLNDCLRFLLNEVFVYAPAKALRILEDRIKELEAADGK